MARSVASDFLSLDHPAVEEGEAEVEHDEVTSLVARDLERLFTVGRLATYADGLIRHPRKDEEQGTSAQSYTLTKTQESFQLLLLMQTFIFVMVALKFLKSQEPP